MITKDQTVTIQLEKTVRATPERVFAALTQSDQVPRWFGPSYLMAGVVDTYDARPGGKFRMTINASDGETFVAFGKFLEVRPNEVLRMTWQWEESEVQPYDSELEFKLRPVKDGTHVTLTHSGLATQEYADKHKEGWTGCLNRLSHVGAEMDRQIAKAIGHGQWSVGRLKSTLAAVPDDKLLWSPSETALPALHIAARFAVDHEDYIDELLGKGSSSGSFDDQVAKSKEKARKFKTREEVVAAIDEAFMAQVKAIESLTPERFAETISFPEMEFPVAEHINMPSWFASNQAAQIDYLQTVWGDLKLHM